MDFLNQIQNIIPAAALQITALVLGILVVVFLTLTVVFAVKNHKKNVELDSANRMNEDFMEEKDMWPMEYNKLLKEMNYNTAMDRGTIDGLRREIALLKQSYRKIAMKDAIFVSSPHLTGEKGFGDYMKTAEKIYKFYVGKKSSEIQSAEE